MSFKESKVYSVINQKCPICHEGDLFVYRNPYKLKKLFEMHEKCAVCGFRFEPETGFYYGAMYTAYGLSVALSMIIFLLYYFSVTEFKVVSFLVLNSVVLLVLFPLTFRLSRSLWINLLFHYKPGPYDQHKH